MQYVKFYICHTCLHLLIETFELFKYLSNKGKFMKDDFIDCLNLPYTLLSFVFVEFFLSQIIMATLIICAA